MKKLCFLWVFILGLISTYPAFAVKCYICGDETQSAIQCEKPPTEEAKNAHESKNTEEATKYHEICKDCLKIQVGSELGDGHDLHEGLKCYGDDAQCKQKYQIEAVKTVLSRTETLENLNTSLKAQEDRSVDPTSEREPKRQSTDSEKTQVIPVQEFQNQIQEAFNLECPGISNHPQVKNTGNKFSGILAPIEGCNAASCAVCKARFCYLCLKPEPDSKAAHAHARAHSNNYWENRDGHTGLVPGRPQQEDYLEYEEVPRRETITIRGSKGNHSATVLVIEKGKPYTYTDRYHWEIVREKLEGLFESGKVQPNQEAVARLKVLLKENKMWPFPVGKNAEQWSQEVNEYFTQEMDELEKMTLTEAERSKKFDLLKRNRIALLQNETLFQYRIAKREKSNWELKKAAKTHTDILKGVLLSLNAPALTSLDASHGQGGGGNDHITPLLEDHEDARIRNLVTELQRDYPGFFALGGEDGRIYRITDPAGAVPPFVLSDNLKDRNQLTAQMTYQEAVRACPPASQPPSKEQLESLERAMRAGGRYNPNALPGIAGTFVWSSTVHPSHSDFGFTLEGYYGRVIPVGHSFLYSVRCARQAPV